MRAVENINVVRSVLEKKISFRKFISPTTEIGITQI